MILKRQEKNGLIKAIYDSSNILASTFDTVTSDLTLIFKAGTQYRYNNVAKTDYLRFEVAESQGAVFSSHIKKYDFTKLEPINPSLITEEIQAMKAAEDQALLEGMKLKLHKLIKRVSNSLDAVPSENTDIFEAILTADLHKLKKEIDDYLTLKK